MKSPTPGWLDAAKLRHPPRSTTAVHTSPNRDPAPGQLRRLLPIDLVGRPALVLIVASDPEHQAHTVVLVSPDTDFGGDRDLLLGPTETGLPYDVLVQAELVGYAWTTQLDTVYSVLDDRWVDAVQQLQVDDGGTPEPDLRAGPPIVNATDARWQFKLTELSRLQSLTGPCTEQLIDGERHLLPDPVSLRPPTVSEDPLPALEYILALSDQVRSGSVTFPVWLVDLILSDHSFAQAYRDAGLFGDYQALVRMLETWLPALPEETVPPDLMSAEDGGHVTLEMATQFLLDSERRRGRTSVWLVTRAQTGAPGPQVQRARVGDSVIQCVRTPCPA